MFEDEICMRFAMRWAVPAKFSYTEELPFSVENMLSLLGFKYSFKGNVIELHSSEDFRKHTEGIEITISAPDGTVVIRAHYKPNNTYDSMYSYFTNEAIEMAKVEHARREEARKALPWYNPAKYFGS